MASFMLAQMNSHAEKGMAAGRQCLVLRKLTGCLSMENARNMRSTMLPCLCG